MTSLSGQQVGLSVLFKDERQNNILERISMQAFDGPSQRLVP
jgi:hypothetical protein